MDPAKRKWYDQRQNARRRGIEWDLPFDIWMKIWVDSGQWPNRGVKTPDQYVMSRIGDQGPYRADNVVIKTNYDNVREGNVGRAKPQPKMSCISCHRVISADKRLEHWSSNGCQKSSRKWLRRTGILKPISQQGRLKPKVMCPHCGQTGGKPAMMKHHFDRCKKAPRTGLFQDLKTAQS